jgi:hypothetical protein
MEADMQRKTLFERMSETARREPTPTPRFLSRSEQVRRSFESKADKQL